jgi:hypothetical protein
MHWLSLWIGGLCVVVSLIGAGPGTACAAEISSSRTTASSPMPLDDLPKSARDPVRVVLEHPNLHTSGPTESFTCKPAQYYEFLEHPDRAVALWRKLGAKCLSITDRGKGRFGWADEHGSDVHWDMVLSGPKMRVWYSEGQVRPNAWLPTVSFQAVVILHLTETKDAEGRTTVQHQAELFIHSDSKTAALAARLLGPSAPRLAETYIAQIQTFFSALSWYCDQHPEALEKLDREKRSK